MTDRVLFGERLRRARERRRLTLQDIADRTKVSAARLKSLEEGTCAHWPGGVYSRSYVRVYAEHAGLDPAETLEEFVGLFPDLAWAQEDRHTDVIFVRARSGIARGAGSSLRLVLEEPALPLWRALLMRLGLTLHRWATGATQPAPVPLDAAPEEERAGFVTGAVPAGSFDLQVD